MRWYTGIALMGSVLVSAGCGASFSTAPLTSQRVAYQAPPDHRPTDQSGSLADDGQPLRKITHHKPAADRPIKAAHNNSSSDGRLSQGWAKEEQMDNKEDWERQLDRKIRNICRGC